ncbi:MAG: DUF11 domain-containing protein [Chlorobi bacterium]|nr:DUF11 domain-containing protein [Chlorobiota bacterium]
MVLAGNTAHARYNLSGTSRAMKSNQMGDIEILCNNTPIELGNRIWFDVNSNGIQDPNELPISGVKVILQKGDGTSIDTVITNTNGNYLFSNEIKTNSLFAHYGIDLLKPGLNFKLVVPDIIGANKQSILLVKVLTSTDVGGPGQPDVRDNDASLIGNNGVINLTTGVNGETNHTFDIGFTIQTCTSPQISSLTINQVTCTNGVANSDGNIVVVATGTAYNCNTGATYTGTFTGSTAITGGTFTKGSLPNPTTSAGQQYTIRIYNGLDSTCYKDTTVTLPQVVCCALPVYSGIVINPATCTNGVANSDGNLVVTVLGTKYGCNTGSVFTGDFAGSTVITGGTFTKGSLPNPTTGAGQQYTFRVYNGDSTCYQDTTVTLPQVNCCVISVISSVTINRATCNGGVANSDGNIVVVATGTAYNCNTGATFTGTFAGSTAITGGTFTKGSLPNPTTSGGQQYTIRIYNGLDSTCYKDTTVTLPQVVCCALPVYSGIAINPATCTNGVANSDGNLVVTVLGTKYGCNTGSVFTGDFAGSTVITGGTFTKGSLPNPTTGAGQQYTFRVYNGDSTCYQDTTVTLPQVACCVLPVFTSITINPATCTRGIDNGDASIVVVVNGTKYSCNTGATYTGTFAGSTAITGGTFTKGSLPNPTTSAGLQYTIRIYNGLDSTCFKDTTVTLPQVNCCVLPTVGQVSIIQVTCDPLGAPNSDGMIDLSGITNGDKADIKQGISYLGGPVYGAGTNKTVTGGAVSFTGLSNPGTPAGQSYTVRIWSYNDTCYKDTTVLLPTKTCIIPKAALGNFVWKDYDRNGRQDALEPGIPGVTVTLCDSANNVLGTEVTDGSGQYLFDSLEPNKTYIVKFPTVLPDGCRLTSPNQVGVADSLDSDADGTTGSTTPVFLGPKETNLTLDAGYIVSCPTSALIANINGPICINSEVTLNGTVTFENGALPFQYQFCRVNTNGSYTPVGAIGTVTSGTSPVNVSVTFTATALDNGKTFILKVTKAHCEDLISDNTDPIIVESCIPNFILDPLEVTSACPGDYVTLNGHVEGSDNSLPFTYQFFCEKGGVLTPLGVPMTVTTGTSPWALSQTILITSAYHNKNFVAKITNIYTGQAGVFSNYVGPLNVRNSCCPTPEMKPVVGGCPGDFIHLNAEITSGVFPITYQFFCEQGGVYTPISLPKTALSGTFPIVIADSIIATTAYNGKNFTIKAWSPLACPTGVYAVGEGPISIRNKCCPREEVIDPLPQCVNDTFRISGTVFTPEFPFTYQFLCYDGTTYTPVGLAKTVLSGTSPVSITSDVIQATNAINAKQYTVRVTTATCPYPGTLAVTSEPLVVTSPCCPKPALTIDPTNVCWGDKVMLNGTISSKEFPVTYQYFCEVGGVYTAVTPARTLLSGITNTPISVVDSFIATTSHNGKNFTLQARTSQCPNGVYAVNAGPLTVRNNCCPNPSITLEPNNVCYGDTIHLASTIFTPEFPLHYQFYCETGGTYTPVSPAMTVLSGTSPATVNWDVVATTAFNGKNFTVKAWTNGICPAGVFAINAGPLTVRNNCCPKINIDSITPQPVCIGETFEVNATIQTALYPVSYQIYCEQGGNYTALEPPVTIVSGTGTETIDESIIATTNLSGKNIVIKVWNSTCPNGVYSLNYGPFRTKFCRFDLALRKKIDFTATPSPFVPGSDVTFQIEVFNQGDIAAYNVEVTDYIPSNFTLNDGSWTSVGGGKVTKTLAGPIMPNTSQMLSITLKIDPNFRGDLIVNTSEISKADNDDNPATPNAYVDIDSDPDNDINNDGVAKNDMIDEDGKNNPNDDEDDHDIEPVRVDRFDLALTKKIQQPSPSSYSPGDTVNYVIEVTNQGTIPANYIEVTDYIPSGLILIDNQWTIPVGNTTTRPFFATLPPGSSYQMNIRFRIDPNYTGGDITNVSEIDSTNTPYGPFVDIDSWPDNNPNNDGTAKNDVTNEDRKLDGTKDEDDSDPETIKVVLDAQLGDKVWYDNNLNGIQDPSEPGVKDVIVCLYNGSTLLKQDTTDANGNYLFEKLSPGTYSVKFKDLPSGYIFTDKDQGTNDSTDSDADITGSTVSTVLTAGEKDSTWDAGIWKPACIGNRIWVDLNKDGIQDNGEPGAFDVGVTLYKSDGSLVSTQNSVAGGMYKFGGLRPGDYYVVFNKPAFFDGFTIKDQGSNEDKDSDVDPLGKTVVTNLVSGEYDSTWDAGLIVEDVKPACIGDRVWVDQNNNGIQEYGEASASGVEVILKQADGTPVDTMYTDAFGYYSFCDLMPGDYYVCFRLPDNFEWAPSNQGTNDSLDNDVNPNTGCTEVTTLTSGENDPTWDAGLHPKQVVLLASIGDRIWVDTDKDGIQDSGEPGASGVCVKLYKSDGSWVGTMNTDGTGHYEFTGLIPGDYYVEFCLPNEFTFTNKDQGTNDSLDSDVDPITRRTIVTTLVGGENDPTWDAGLVTKEILASVGDRVWVDTNKNGIQDPGEPGASGVCVRLYKSNGDFVALTYTDGTGYYLFDGLQAGDYYVTFCLQDNFTFTIQDQGGNEATDSDPNITTGTTATFTLNAGDAKRDVDAGLVSTPEVASIGDRVWVDLNKDGVQDVGEPGAFDVKVVLHNADGSIVSVTHTVANGFYQFTGLTPGDYYVTVCKPDEFEYTVRDQGGNDAKDSDVDPLTGNMIVTTLVAGENDMTWDGGLIVKDQPLKAVIGDRLWLDKNKNGVQDPGEPGVPNVKVCLYKADGTIVRCDTTDSNGNYLFTEVDPGCYYVKFGLPTGYDFTSKDQGSNDAIDSDVDLMTGMTSTFCVVGGETKLDVDAGVVCHAPTVVPSITSRGDANELEITLTGIVTGIDPTFNYQFCVVVNGVSTPLQGVQMITNGTQPFILTYTFIGTSADLSKKYVLKVGKEDCPIEVVLPVELAEFTGELIDNGIAKLDWRTASETNNAGFDLERSIVRNGVEGPFEFVTYAKSQSQGGTSASGYKYNHSDDVNWLIGDAEKLVYRLKIKDIDGRFEYAKQRVTIELKEEVTAGLRLNLSNATPNPANTKAKFTYTVPVATKVTINIYDGTGKIVKVIEEGQVSEGSHEVVMNLQDLSSGVYRYSLNAMGKKRN